MNTWDSEGQGLDERLEDMAISMDWRPGYYEDDWFVADSPVRAAEVEGSRFHAAATNLLSSPLTHLYMALTLAVWAAVWAVWASGVSA